MHISEKYIVSIPYFLEHYFQIVDAKSRKFTHDFMEEFLIEKTGRGVKRVSIDLMHQEDILKGKMVYVKDASGKVIPYRTPGLSLLALEEELKRNCDREELAHIRENILSENCLHSKQKCYCKREER